ncbi:hypothetical protein [uncultured Roseibium sp.]|uniref:hypothetical protein n=1 Tax=uncultured Roseibium sp. TaxID=1936171 RepID=UPI0026114C6A|nr:hypothetical protein [uncultured Roseibium sp.]
MTIQLPPFEPDRASFAPSASPSVFNALPVRDGWGPFADLSIFTSALPSACRGAVSVRTNTGAYKIFAGTETALYELNNTDYTWTDRTGTTTPAVPSGDSWWFVLFGDTLICGNLGTDTQVININSGTAFADLAGSPPRSKYAVVAGEYLLLGHLDGAPRAVQTSGLGDSTFWTRGKRGCSRQTFADGGDVQGLIGAENGAIIAQLNKWRQLSIAVSGGYSYTTREINPDRGVFAPRSLVQIGPGQFFYYSTDGFMVGVEGRPIGAERVDKWFKDQVDTSQLTAIRAVADPFNKIVWVQADQVGSSKILVGYNWQLDRWCPADIDVTEMLALATPDVSWDGLATLYTTIDEVTEPFDSPLFAGGIPRFGAFDTDNKLGLFTGAAREATLETADIEFNPGWKTLFQEARVYTDATDFTLQVGTSEFHGGDRTWSSEITPYAATKACWFNNEGRLHRLRLKIAEGAAWNHAVGIEERGKRTGKI